jgi:hypothetical protein
MFGGVTPCPMTTAPQRISDLLDDRYKIVREIGRGSMGVVYECTTRATASRVAVKVVQVGTSSSARARADREVRALAHLNSPHIVQLRDFVDREDTLYFEYELVDGETLDHTEKLPLDAALRVGTAVASALATAHRAGVIHRDIKPSNVIVPRAGDGSLDFAASKLLDFGVAGALRHRREERAVTRSGEVFGSPLYMSPEQLLADEQSAATDVYGVGALLFKLVYGRPVFEGEGFLKLMRQVVSAEAVLPDEPAIPTALRALILRCLAKAPHARFEDGAALLHALQQIATGPSPAQAGGRALPHVIGPAVKPADLPELSATQPRSWLQRWGIAAALSGIGFLVSVGVSVMRAHDSGVVSGKALAFLPLALLALAGVGASWLVAYIVNRAIEARRVPLARNVVAVLGHANAVSDLSKSLALDVEQLLVVCRSLDQHMLAKTLALMVGEYEQAVASDDRQAALMKAVELMEKLNEKLAPWYVKRQAVLTWSVGLAGSLVAAAKTVGELLELLRK